MANWLYSYKICLWYACVHLSFGTTAHQRQQRKEMDECGKQERTRCAKKASRGDLKRRDKRETKDESVCGNLEQGPSRAIARLCSRRRARDLQRQHHSHLPPARWYAVCRGRRPGVYMTWREVEAQVRGFPGAVYRRCDSEEAARALLAEGTAQAHTRGSPDEMAAADISTEALGRWIGQVLEAAAGAATHLHQPLFVSKECFAAFDPRHPSRLPTAASPVSCVRALVPGPDAGSL